MLSRIEIANFKSIGQASVNLTRQNVIVGPNGVGKSNLLDAIHFLRDAANDGLDHAVTKRHGILSIRRWSKTRPFNIILKVHFAHGETHGDYKIAIASAGEEFSVIEEEGNWFSPPPFGMDTGIAGPVLHSFKRNSEGLIEFNLPKSPFEISLLPAVHRSELLITQFGSSSFSPLSYFFRDLWKEVTSCGAYSIYPNKIREPQTISNSDVLADDGTNLASIIRQMRETKYRTNREALTSEIKQVLPIVGEIHVKSAGGFYVPVFRVRETSGGQAHDLNMAQISDGTLRMLGMLAAFYQPKAPVRITLEEPEQMIHPGLLPVLVDALEDYVEEGSVPRQVLITTHSPNLLDLFPPDSIIGARFEDGVSSFSAISERQLKIVRERLFSAGELLVAEGIFN